MIGRTLSHFRIVDKIGEGGMGVVYRATDVRLDRSVAIKVLSPNRAGDAEWRSRFVREAKAASALNHPHIVTVYDIDSADGVDFLAMEYVPGKTLHACIGGRGLPLPDVVNYLSQLAAALSAAHEAGLVHRDVKPANIIVSDTGHVKLLDFGLARTGAAAASGASETVTAPVPLTEPGAILGTVDYLSPEQARGQVVDQRTDVWAFGCVLFEALTGRRPFGKGTPAEVLARILEVEPDWSRLPPSTPSNLRHLLRACLRKDPHRRLRRIDPVWLEGSDNGALAGTGRSRGAAAAWVALGLAGAALLGWRGAVALRPAMAQPALMRLSAPVESIGGALGFNRPVFAIAPDGSAIVSVSRALGDPPRLFVRRFSSLGQVPLQGTEGAHSPFFSPDGRQVGFFAGTRLRTVSLDQGGVRTVCEFAGAAWGGAWAPGDVIVFAAAGVLMRVPASGGTPERITRLDGGEAQHRWPAVSPDGRTLVFTTSNSTGQGLEEPKLVAQSLDSGHRETLPVDATYALFAPGGDHLILVQSANAMAVAFDAGRLATSGSAVPLIEGIVQSSSGAAQVGVSSSVLAYLEGEMETRRLVWVDRAGHVEPIDAPPRQYVHPRLSPEGSRIAVAVTEPKNDIFIIDDIARGTLTRLTFEGSNAYPIWTPDGQRITYVSSQQGHPPNLFWKAADGTGAEARLDTSDRTQVSETWHPNGRTLFFVERQTAVNWDIMTLAVTGAVASSKAAFQATPFLDGTPQISPTGRYIAYISDESGTQELFVRSFPGAGFKQRVSDSGGGQPAWRGDERELYFRAADAMMAAPVTVEPQVRIGQPSVLFRGAFASIQGKNYDVSRDGQRFLMVEPIEPAPPREVIVVLNWMADLRTRLR